MPEQPREIAGEHQRNRDLVFSTITAGVPSMLTRAIVDALGRATDRREVYVDVKILSDVSALLITRKVPLPPRSGGGVA